MQTRSLLFMLILFPTMAFSTPSPAPQCISGQYHQYIEASISWYEALVGMTVEKNPELEGVANWFLEARRNHFLFSQQTFTYYLMHSPEKLNLDSSVETWVNLSQQDIKNISLSESPIASAAKNIYDFRQQKAHTENYKLRKAFADLLSHPDTIKQPLERYNQKITTLNADACHFLSS